jgi:hypothetical protein
VSKLFYVTDNTIGMPLTVCTPCGIEVVFRKWQCYPSSWITPPVFLEEHKATDKGVDY